MGIMESGRVSMRNLSWLFGPLSLPCFHILSNFCTKSSLTVTLTLTNVWDERIEITDFPSVATLKHIYVDGEE